METPKMSESKLPVCRIYKMKDGSENKRITKLGTADLPMRALISGKSLLSGKTNFVGNLILRPFPEGDEEGANFYNNDFKGEDIYIVCPSIAYDKKWKDIIYTKRIPPSNVFDSYDEANLEKVYKGIEEKFLYLESMGKFDTHSLIIFDDVSFSGNFKAKLNGIMSRIFCNSRHINLSVIATSQKYTDFSTTMRENASLLVLFAATNKQIDLIYEDVGECSKKDFVRLFRAATKERNSYLVVNYTNPPEQRFQDTFWQPIEGFN